MQIVKIKYLEHNGQKYYEGDRVTLNGYNKPEITGIITLISENEFRPTIHLLHHDNDDDEDALAILSLFEIEKIQKCTSEGP